MAVHCSQLFRQSRRARFLGSAGWQRVNPFLCSSSVSVRRVRAGVPGPFQPLSGVLQRVQHEADEDTSGQQQHQNQQEHEQPGRQEAVQAGSRGRVRGERCAGRGWCGARSARTDSSLGTGAAFSPCYHREQVPCESDP